MGEFGGETKFNFYGDLDNSDTQVARPLKKAAKKATKGKKGATGKKPKWDLIFGDIIIKKVLKFSMFSTILSVSLIYIPWLVLLFYLCKVI